MSEGPSRFPQEGGGRDPGLVHLRLLMALAREQRILSPLSTVPFRPWGSLVQVQFAHSLASFPIDPLTIHQTQAKSIVDAPLGDRPEPT